MIRYNPLKFFLLYGWCLISGLFLMGSSSLQAATNCTQIPQAECETLIALYNSTNGNQWYDSPVNQWNFSNTPCSDWTGIACDGGHVTHIARAGQGLKGTLPDLSALTNLRELDLGHNQLSGIVPDLSALTKLEVLWLGSNQFNGNFPNLSALTPLQNLRLYENHLSGPVPNLNAFTHLQEIALNSNQLSGSLPNLSTLSNLQYLDVHHNQFDGFLSDLSALTNLQYVELDGNQVTHPVPPWLSEVYLWEMFLEEGFCGETSSRQCTVTFRRKFNYLTVQVIGSGWVVKNSEAIKCDSTCQTKFSKRESVTLEAFPEQGVSLIGWQGGCAGQNNPLSVTITKDINCVALFGNPNASPSDETSTIPSFGNFSISVVPSSVNFNQTILGQSVFQTLSIHNSGQVPLHINTVTLNGDPSFALDQNICTEIPPESSCDLQVSFTPQITENKQATLSISSDDPDTPLITVPLNGIACPDNPQTSVKFYPNSLHFGTQPIGESSSLTSSLFVTILGGCGTPNINNTLQVTGSHASEFSLKDKKCYQGRQTDSYISCKFSVVFSPRFEGQKEAQLDLTFNDPNIKVPPLLIQAQAAEGQAYLEISPQNIDFGTVLLDHFKSEPITIKNTGKVNLKLKEIKVSGDSSFNTPTLWNCYVYSRGYNIPELPPNSQCQITASFIPTEVGDKQGILTLTSNASNSPIQQLALLGKAQETSDCSDHQVTIESAQSGAWGIGDTWNTGIQPTETDIVRIKAGHTIKGTTYTKVRTLCIEPQAILESPDDQEISPLWIEVTDYIKNQGTIRGKDGTNETNGAECPREMLGQGNCARPGANINLITGSKMVNKWEKGEEWWWEGSGAPIRNEGSIIAGKGGDGSQYASQGGRVIILGRNTLNTPSGVIRGGEGGHLLGASKGEAGKGGAIQIWGKLGGPGYLKNYGETRAGKGGKCNSGASEAQTGGRGGNLWLVSVPEVYLEGIQAAGRGDKNCSLSGTKSRDGNLIIEPSIISIAGAQTKLEGGDITIFGGKDWVLNLSNLDHPVIQASGDITLAVGEGGMIDFRGSSQNFLEAQGQVTLFSDTIVLDEEKTLTDVVAAQNLVVAPSKILRDVSLSASERVIGLSATTVPIMVVLNNNGPEQDTYDLNVIDLKGWPLEQRSKTMTVEGLSTVEMAFMMTLPSTRGEMNRIQVTATSQADPNVSATQEIQVGVAMEDAEVMIPLLPQAPSSNLGETITPPSNPEGTTGSSTEGTITPSSHPEGTMMPPNSEGLSDHSGISPSFNSIVTLEACPSTGVITSLCSNRHQTIRDATFEASAKVSGGELAGMIKNLGFISQVTIQPHTELSGGILSGYIINQGTLRDFTFVGASIQGGILAGTITNLSQVGGTIIDVTFAPNAHLQGGKLQGKLQGDEEAPALLEHVKILKGSKLSGVSLGKGVILEKEVTLE